MSSTFQNIVLALVQGLSEFLPISSSGHLLIIQQLFQITPQLSLDILLNTATFFSVLFFFRKQFKDFFQKSAYIFISTLPADFFTLFFKDFLVKLFISVSLLPLSFLYTSLILFLTYFFSFKKIKKLNKLNFTKATIIGLFQALAIFPGVSRSASTIFAGLLMGLSWQQSFLYSFYLFIPASLGALIFAFMETDIAFISFSSYLLPFVICFLIGLMALFLLRKLLQSAKLWYFSFYSLSLSFILMLLV